MFNSWLYPILFAPFIGSFLGVIVARIESSDHRGMVFGRSVCMSCGVRLAPRDLVPVISWLALRGRCRFCGARVGLFLPLIELASVLIAVWSGFVFSGGLLWASCLLGWALLALAATDLKYYLLPDFLTLPLIPAGLAAGWLFEPDSLAAHGLGALAGYAFVIVLRFLYSRLRGREGMGLGDAKLLSAAGAWVSWTGLPSVILLGALGGLCYALCGSSHGGTLSLTNRVPFGAFLCLGIWLVWLYGPLTVG
jgi:leader peptidase (prepilin peptidase)/N-methyltransferase